MFSSFSFFWPALQARLLSFALPVIVFPLIIPSLDFPVLPLTLSVLPALFLLSAGPGIVNLLVWIRYWHLIISHLTGAVEEQAPKGRCLLNRTR
jgi:hypothetical protein